MAIQPADRQLLGPYINGDIGPAGFTAAMFSDHGLVTPSFLVAPIESFDLAFPLQGFAFADASVPLMYSPPRRNRQRAIPTGSGPGAGDEERPIAAAGDAALMAFRAPLDLGHGAFTLRRSVLSNTPHFL